LVWFEEAKESQGSLSARSFHEAKNANKNGKYLVGNFHQPFDEFLQQTATLNSVIRLEVTYEVKKDQTVEDVIKELTLDDVHDLQSRLSLLGRQKNETEEDVRDGTFEKKYFLKV